MNRIRKVSQQEQPKKKSMQDKQAADGKAKCP